MITKNNSLQFSINQCNQLKQLKENNKLHELQEQCRDFKNEFETLNSEKNQALENLEKINEHLLTIQEDYQNAKQEENNWEKKLKDGEWYVDNKIEVLQNICLLLGYNVFKIQILDNCLQVTLRYRDICYISYCETAELYDVLEIYPQHPNFLQIQQFLKNSQDLGGLLTSLRKYFDSAIQLKENEYK